ncbi:MAG: AMP-binding protein, partial [Candidatus Dormibacteria bacterium]
MVGQAGEEVLWEPSPQLMESCRLADYAAWLGREAAGPSPTSYSELWQWSVSDPGAFWRSLVAYFGVAEPPPSEATPQGDMPFAKWFPGTALNYAEQALRHADPQREVVVGYSETGARRTLTGTELSGQAASLAAWLAERGVGPGDRVAGYLPNIPQAVVACLATASLGAVWSSCSPDFGEQAVLDRLEQIEPAILFAADGYRYGGRAYDRRPLTRSLAARLSSVRQVVAVPVLEPDAAPWLERAVAWKETVSASCAPRFEQVAFDHPLWILYSSGTTGLPKPIVHGHGGMVLEHLKALALHADIGPSSRFFWFTTTGW